MRKIILNDSSEYEIYRCGASGGYLYIGFPQNVIDFKEILKKFTDEEITKHIISTYDFDGMETVFDGYTELVSVNKDEYDNRILICLKIPTSLVNTDDTQEVLIP